MQESICQTTSSPYELDLKNELAYLGGGVALSITGHLLKNQVDPLTPQEIDQLSAESIWEVDKAPLFNYSPEVALATDRLSVVGWIMPLRFAIPRST